jgi:hypothetical protein
MGLNPSSEKNRPTTLVQRFGINKIVLKMAVSDLWKSLGDFISLKVCPT